MNEVRLNAKSVGWLKDSSGQSNSLEHLLSETESRKQRLCKIEMKTSSWLVDGIDMQD